MDGSALDGVGFYHRIFSSVIAKPVSAELSSSQAFLACYRLVDAIARPFADCADSITKTRRRSVPVMGVCNLGSLHAKSRSTTAAR